MGTRLAVLAPMGLDPKIDIIKQILEDIFVRNLEKVKQEDTEIDFHLLERGFTDIDFFGYQCFNVRNDYELFEAAVGLGVEDYDGLVIDPVLPDGWDQVHMKRAFRQAQYDITIRRAETDEVQITVDGEALEGRLVPYDRYCGEHTIEVVVPK